MSQVKIREWINQQWQKIDQSWKILNIEQLSTFIPPTSRYTVLIKAYMSVYIDMNGEKEESGLDER